MVFASPEVPNFIQLKYCQISEHRSRITDCAVKVREKESDPEGRTTLRTRESRVANNLQHPPESAISAVEQSVLVWRAE